MGSGKTTTLGPKRQVKWNPQQQCFQLIDSALSDGWSVDVSESHDMEMSIFFYLQIIQIAYTIVCLDWKILS